MSEWDSLHLDELAVMDDSVTSFYAKRANGADAVNIALHPKLNGQNRKENLTSVNGHNDTANGDKSNGAISSGFDVKEDLSDMGNGHAELEDGMMAPPRRLDEYEVDFS